MAENKMKRAAPTRACESCGTSYFPRRKACPKCGAPNPTSGGRPSESRRSQAAAGATPIDAAIQSVEQFVEQCGGLKAAKDALERIERINEL